MAGCLSQVWITSIVTDLRAAVAAKEAEGPAAPGPQSPGVTSASSSGPLLDCLRGAVEERAAAPYGIDDLKNDRAWQERFHTAMSDVLREDYGEPVPHRHGSFVPETFAGDILALTRGMF